MAERPSNAIFDTIADIIADREAPWRALAACLDAPTEVFFPVGDSGNLGKGGWNESPRLDEARALCARCPVKDDCHDYWLSGNEGGWWAGEWRPGHWTAKGRAQAEAATMRRSA